LGAPAYQLIWLTLPFSSMSSERCRKRLQLYWPRWGESGGARFPIDACEFQPAGTSAEDRWTESEDRQPLSSNMAGEIQPAYRAQDARSHQRKSRRFGIGSTKPFEICGVRKVRTAKEIERRHFRDSPGDGSN